MHNRIKLVPNVVNDYKYGGNNPQTIYFDGSEYFVYNSDMLYYYTLHQFQEPYKRYIMCRRGPEDMTDYFKRDMYGFQARNEFNNILYKYYTKDEIDERLHMFEFDEPIGPYHYTIDIDSDLIIKFENCYYYDINSAYGSALIEIFPKAKYDIMYLFKHRHENGGKFKNIMNYYTGLLTKKGGTGQYSKTYWWIVKRTRELLLKTITKVGGTLLYANTDGFIVSNPRYLLTTSNEIGDFKISDDVNGQPVYWYCDKNYYLMQFQNGTKKGTCRCAVRKDIDLSVGQVVHYTQDTKTTPHKILNQIKEIIKCQNQN